MCSTEPPLDFHCRCSQHPNDNNDTECQRREHAVAATDVVESSTSTSRVTDELEVIPQGVAVQQRRDVQHRQQSQRQQRGRPRLQSNRLGKKGRPSEAEAAIKMVVDGEITLDVIYM